MTELVHRLLRQHKAVCLLVEPEEKAAIKVYEHAGFVYGEKGTGTAAATRLGRGPEEGALRGDEAASEPA